LNEPAKILDKVTDIVIETFEKGEEDVKDGMDISLCAIDTTTNIVHYAGANNSLYYIREGNFHEVKATKQPVGKYDARKPFVNNEIQLKKGDVFYLFTDGFADQFGGEKGKKFKYKNFKNLLVEIHQKEPDVQHDILKTTFIDWKADNEQVDDVCIAGIWVQ
jgi:serine phosphatase RsbU (regulator of sigma subunit)